MAAVFLQQMLGSKHWYSLKQKLGDFIFEVKKLSLLRHNAMQA